MKHCGKGLPPGILTPFPFAEDTWTLLQTRATKDYHCTDHVCLLGNQHDGSNMQQTAHNAHLSYHAVASSAFVGALRSSLNIALCRIFSQPMTRARDQKSDIFPRLFGHLRCNITTPLDITHMRLLEHLVRYEKHHG